MDLLLAPKALSSLRLVFVMMQRTSCSRCYLCSHDESVERLLVDPSCRMCKRYRHHHPAESRYYWPLVLYRVAHSNLLGQYLQILLSQLWV